MAESAIGKCNSKIMNQLDKSTKGHFQDELENERKKYLGGENEKISGFLSESEDEPEPTEKKSGLFYRFTNSIITMTGNKVIFVF
jgi:hypothetical protein